MRVILAHSGLAYWMKVGLRLQQIPGWEIVYVVGNDSPDHPVHHNFPGAVFHHHKRAVRGLAAEGLALTPTALDAPLLSAMAPYEGIFLRMLDRYDVDGSLDLRTRVFTYHNQMMYWLAVLDHFKPEAVVYRTTPHMGYDYLLFALCRLRGVRTVMFDRIAMPGYLFPMEDFREGSAALTACYQRLLAEDAPGEVPLAAESLAYLARLRGAYSEGIPLHLKYKLRNLDLAGPANMVHSLMDLAKASLRAFKPARKGELAQAWSRSLGKLKKRSLKRHYQQLTQAPDYQKPYIFVALQCEPERQTTPSGGLYGNQYLMVKLLSEVAPPGWEVVVKEHVSQFKPYQIGERARTHHFYDYLASLPRVRLAPLTLNAFELIDHARAVASVSGTVSWEAVNRDIPALLFGYSWYRDCEGVFVTHSREACDRALQAIRHGYRVERRRLLWFIKALELTCVRGVNDKIYNKIQMMPEEELVDNLTRSLVGFLMADA